MEVSGLLDQVLFVIVLYRQSLNGSMAFQSLQPLIQKYGPRVSVFVYDNSEEQSTDWNGVTHYIHNPNNPGVSAAYNQAFNYADKNNFRFLMLMDQDTSFPESVFDSYSHAVATHPEIHVFAPIAKDHQKQYSPFRLRRGRGLATRMNAEVYPIGNTKFINSGLLVSVSAFEKCGGYDERFPLDFSDIVFCDRLSAKDYNICVIDDVIYHQHSSSLAGDKQRFENYLHALALYKLTSKTNASYWWGGFPRAVKLSVQLRNQWFLKRFFGFRV